MKSCKQKHDRPARALYVHVPFCRAKCRYCDFYSLPQAANLADAWLAAAEKELAHRAGQLARPPASVYVGGGTPTSLDAEPLRRLLEGLGEWVEDATEFSIEANPGTLNPWKVELLRDSKANRVTLGVQSFDDRLLECLGRIHSAEDVRPAVASLREAGFDNLGFDLIYGVPGQSPESWRETLRRACELRPQHISCYALSFEPGTEMMRDLKTGRVKEVDEDLQRRMYDLAVEALAAAGFEQYELSNFAKPGFRSRHNGVYWRNEPYVGIGPAAASYLDGRRSRNVPDLQAYLRAVAESGSAEADSERLDPPAAMAETVMLGLRLTEGIALADFRERFGCDLEEIFPRTLDRYREEGGLERTPTHLRLRREAYFVCDAILADFLDEAEGLARKTPSGYNHRTPDTWETP
jgi:oxygen-independent coproporphyrinogen-3 oxidase